MVNSWFDENSDFFHDMFMKNYNRNGNGVIILAWDFLLKPRFGTYGFLLQVE